MTDDKAAEAAREIVAAGDAHAEASAWQHYAETATTNGPLVARAYLALADQMGRIHAASAAWGDPASAEHQAGDGLVVRRVRDLAGMAREQTAEIERLREYARGATLTEWNHDDTIGLACTCCGAFWEDDAKEWHYGHCDYAALGARP